MLITLRPQTVITMIGPSHSGKSFQSEEISKYLKSIGKTCKIISSDTIRRELLGLSSTDHIPTSQGFVVSGVAFRKVFSDLKYFMSSPVNTDVIIVDTTGLDPTFRTEIADLVSANGYNNVAFVFIPSKSQLMNRIKGDEEQVQNTFKFVDNQLKRLKERVLPKFNKHNYIETYRINDKVDSLEFTYNDQARVLTFDAGKPAYYGDVHQCIEELKALVQKAKEAGATAHVLNGDWVDKGGEESLKELIDWLYDQVFSSDSKFFLIKGNHEVYVHRHLTDPSYVYVENEETQYFSSLKYLLDPKNIEYKEKFIALVEESYDFSEIKTETTWIIVSHSPCEDIYLGKRSAKALRLMRNTRIEHDENPAVTKIKYVLDAAQSNGLLHMFGHVEVGIGFHVYRNKIALDGGCSSGGHLIACLVDIDNFGRKSYLYEKSRLPSKEILDFSYHIKPWTNVKELTPDQEKKLRRLTKANPMFVSSTMSPSPSFVQDDVPHLETIESAITLFTKRDQNIVIAQKKYMGSRCQIYLYHDLEKCYATSRNGFSIRIDGITEIISNLYEKYKDKFTDLLVIDGELLPWSAMGKGLITYSFKPYYQAIKNELDAINASSIKTVLKDLDVTQHLADLEAFNTQVTTYGSDGVPYFEPFGVICHDGVNLLDKPLDETLDKFDIPYELFDLSKEEDKQKLQTFYDEQISDKCTEGVVIKPNVWSEGLIPNMKIRNPEYLRLVYGYDYMDKLLRFAREKDIRGKLALSIRESELNMHLINAWLKGNTADCEEIYKLLIVEFEKESSLDPRL